MLYDKHEAVLLLNIDTHDLRVQFTDFFCCILFVFGLIGNILGLCIFSSSRRSWRISSVYVYLATCSSITNLFCVLRYTPILHSKSQVLLRDLVGRVWIACKIYEFSFGFRVISSWITLFWMIERLTCVSPRLRALFHRWNASQFKLVLPLVMILLILVGVLAPPLYMYQPQISRGETINSTTNLISDYCGVNSDASIKWQKYFNDLRFGPNHYTIRCLFSELIPAAGIILFNSCIMYHLIQTSRHLSRNHEDKKCQERKRTTSWMNVVLILHSTLFLTSLFSHIAGHVMAVEAHETWWVLLAILANCSLNFYLYCLSGQAFRQQIICFVKQATYHFERLRIRKQQWKQDFHHESLMNQCDYPTNINQTEDDQSRKPRKSFQINSSYRLSNSQSSI